MIMKFILITLILCFISSTIALYIERRTDTLRKEHIHFKDGLPVANIQVGTPAQNFFVVFDTSNSFTWVPSTRCHTKVCREHSQIYNANSSTTAINLFKKVSIKYDEGVCMDATLYTDTITVAGISVNNQAFGSAYSVKGLGGDGYLGSFGLGAYRPDGTINYENPTTLSLFTKRDVRDNGYIPNAFQSSYGIQSMQFSMSTNNADGFYQKRNQDVQQEGEFIFGIDHDIYKGDIAYLKLPTSDYGESPFWKSELKSVKLLDKAEIPIQNKTLAIFNTGLANILVPIQQADQLHSALDAHYDETRAHYVLNSCNNIDQLPTLMFDFSDGYRVSLPAKYYIQQNSENDCYSLIGRHKSDQMDWVLGGAFLHRFYHVYDFANLQVGLAIPKEATDVKIDKLS